jgi:hypothetical protein
MCVVTLSLSISNNIDSPVDVGGFAEPRKILCLSVLYPPLSNYQYTTSPRMGETESPTIGIRAHGLKGCLFFAQK